AVARSCSDPSPHGLLPIATSTRLTFPVPSQAFHRRLCIELGRLQAQRKRSGPRRAVRPPAEDGSFAVVGALVAELVLPDVLLDHRHFARGIVLAPESERADAVVALAFDQPRVEPQGQAHGPPPPAFCLPVPVPAP